MTSLEAFLPQFAQRQLFKTHFFFILAEGYSNIAGLFFVFLFTVNSI